MSEDKSPAAKPEPVAIATESKATTSSATAPTAIQPQQTQVTSSRSELKRLIPLAIFALAALLFYVIYSSWNGFENAFVVKTDDAYVRADVAPLSTRANGIVLKTMVKDYDSVKAGKVLVELRNEDFKDRVVQSEQNVSQAQIKLDDMKQRKEKQDAEVLDAKALLENSRAVAKQSDDTIAIARAAIAEAEANIKVGDANIKQTISAVKSATADVVKQEKQRKREEALLAEESSTKEKVEQVVDDYEKATANLDSQNAAKLKAEAELQGRKAQLLKAKQQLASSITDKDKAFIAIKSRQAEVVARTKQRELLDGEEKELVSELSSKKSALDSSQIDLGYTTVSAPVDGTVGELKVKPGQYVAAGTQIITLISSTPWVIANFRETQIAKVKVGDKATIAVDALSGKQWAGHVESIAPASGAQFSLLPPDNASGNFTKVIQRIPIKIVFDDNQQNIMDLRPGMSVTASITPGSSK